MKRIRFGAVLVIFLCIMSVSSPAQEGVPYIHYFDSREGFESRNWSICQDDHNAILFANKNGISRFDGASWGSVQLPCIPMQIRNHPVTGKVYVLSDHHCGWLRRDGKGDLLYEMLAEVEETGHPMSNIRFSGDRVIIYGEDRLRFFHSDGRGSAGEISADSYGTFAGMIVHPDGIFVNIRGEGLLRLKEDTLVAVADLSSTARRKILFDLPFSGTEVLVGLDNGQLKLFNGTKLTDYSLSDPTYLEEYGLLDGLVLNDSTYAFSSLYGGVLIVSRAEGQIRHALNYLNGLPDDEIYAIGSDRNGGLWITYRFGVCRVDLSLPIRDYSFFPGLEGLPTNATRYDNCLYVTTTEGLFYLTEVRHYREEEIMLRQRVPVRKETIPVGKEEDLRVKQPEIPVIAEEEKATGEVQEKKGFFSRLFNRRNDSRKSRETGEDEEMPRIEEALPDTGEVEKPVIVSEPVEKEPVIETRVVRKKVSTLESIEYVYQKVRGLNTRSEYLLPTETALLVGATSGLYGVRDSIAVRLSDSRNIRAIHGYSDNNYYVISDEGLEMLELRGDGWLRKKPAYISGEPLFSVADDGQYVWVSGYSSVFRITPGREDTAGIRRYDFYSVFPEELHLGYVNDTLFVFSSSDIDFYAADSDTFLTWPSHITDHNNFASMEIFPDANGVQWIKADNRIVALNGSVPGIRTIESYLGLFGNVTSLSSGRDGGYWIVDNNNRIFNVWPQGINTFRQDFRIHVDRVMDAAGEPVDRFNLVFPSDQRMIRIRLSAPFFPGGSLTTFQYIIEGRMEDWSRPSTDPEITLFLESGNYSVRMRARNIFGEISNEENLKITISMPFYRQKWFFLSTTLMTLLLFYLVFYLRERKIRMDKAILEEKVRERTAQIAEQKRQIETQRDEITDSINYAGKIQKAVLPSSNLYEKHFSDHFIIFRPKDIVSGDFYWITERPGQVIFAVADCTGHGVPGAFMSILGNSTLNEITRNGNGGGKLTAIYILDQLRNMINDALSHSGISEATFDGMDIALCIFDRKRMEVEYAGALNPICFVRDGELKVYKPDRIPIGYFPEKLEFTSHRIRIRKGDQIYLFTDGFTDQFGGPDGKKFTTRRFEELVRSISGRPMAGQREALLSALDEWQGDNTQIDDILVMGLRF